jgi:hypothetical protein
MICSITPTNNMMKVSYSTSRSFHVRSAFVPSRLV